MKKITLNVIIIVLAILIFCVIAQNIYIYNSHKLEIKPYKTKIIYMPDIEINLSKEECKKLVADLYDTPHLYLEFKKDVSSSIYIPPIVCMQKGLDNRQFIIDYAHELTHIKYQTSNETFVTFTTFKTLYESDNEHLHYCGAFYGACILSGEFGNTEYDCGWYILDYLKGESLW